MVLHPFLKLPRKFSSLGGFFFFLLGSRFLDMHFIDSAPAPFRFRGLPSVAAERSKPPLIKLPLQPLRNILFLSFPSWNQPLRQQPYVCLPFPRIPTNSLQNIATLFSLLTSAFVRPYVEPPLHGNSSFFREMFVPSARLGGSVHPLKIPPPLILSVTVTQQVPLLCGFSSDPDRTKATFSPAAVLLLFFFRGY